MKILFISDIHGKITNLKYIDDLIIKENFDKIVVLGDLYYSGFIENYEEINPKLVKDLLMKYSDKIICLKGNCDSLVDIKTTDLPISDLALIHVDNIDMYLTHGDVYNIENSNKFKNCILIYGHKHYPFIEKKNDMYYINVGSLSLPRNGSKCSYMIYENKTFTIYDTSGSIINSLSIE